MNTKFLENMGLTNAESKIYQYLLKEGASLAGLITRNTGIHRRTVYDALERLIQKGLVSYIKTNNRKYFEAVEPSRLIDILHEQEDNIKMIMPELQGLHNLSLLAKEKNETIFYRGKQALKSVFDDQLRVGKEILIFAGSADVNEILKHYFPHFDNERMKRNIKVRMIINESERSSKQIKKIPLAEKRFVNKEVPTPVGTYVYGNNVAIVAWMETPVAIVIRLNLIADEYRNMFNLLWKIGKK